MEIDSHMLKTAVNAVRQSVQLDEDQVIKQLTVSVDFLIQFTALNIYPIDMRQYMLRVLHCLKYVLKVDFVRIKLSPTHILRIIV